MAEPGIFAQILDYSNRANPYPLYAELRQTPVSRQPDCTYVVSTYREIAALLHDPRMSSDRRTPEAKAAEAPVSSTWTRPSTTGSDASPCGTSDLRPTPGESTGFIPS